VGSAQPVRGWVSQDYGQRRPAPSVVWSVRARLPLRVVTLLLPAPSPELTPPHVELLTGPDEMPAGVVLGGRERIVFAGDEFLVS